MVFVQASHNTGIDIVARSQAVEFEYDRLDDDLVSYARSLR